MKVLVVDDNAVMREALSVLLKARGVETDYVSTAEEALGRLSLARPDVLVLDQFLPGMDGLDFLRLLRAREEHRSLPVVMLTAASDLVVREIECSLPALRPCVLLRKLADPAAIMKAIEDVKGACA